MTNSKYSMIFIIKKHLNKVEAEPQSDRLKSFQNLVLCALLQSRFLTELPSHLGCFMNVPDPAPLKKMACSCIMTKKETLNSEWGFSLKFHAVLSSLEHRFDWISWRFLGKVHPLECTESDSNLAWLVPVSSLHRLHSQHVWLVRGINLRRWAAPNKYVMGRLRYSMWKFIWQEVGIR